VTFPASKRCTIPLIVRDVLHQGPEGLRGDVRRVLGAGTESCMSAPHSGFP
jgi:hypothetical protein